MNWILKKLLKLHKVRVLLEVSTDIIFIQLYRKHALDFNESEARKFLRKENNKDEEKRDKKQIDNVSFKIAEHQTVKKELEDLKKLQIDIKKYIKLL